MKVIRKEHLAQKIVFVDGLWGSGKTMISPILSAFERVELLSYAYELEQICSLYSLEKISLEVSELMTRQLTDLKLYNTMMSRDLNFRFSDLSSALNHYDPQKYIKRLFDKGDEIIPEKILKEKPILNFASHHLLAYSEPVFSALGERVVFLEVVRHPLYMIKQIALNMEKLIGNVRSFSIYFEYKGQSLPSYVHGWEDLFIESNYMDKAIHYVDQLTKKTEKVKSDLKNNYKNQILTVPFERFTINPDEFLPEIEKLLGTKSTEITREMMRKQKVPREKYSDGIELDIYKRCGWEPSTKGLTEIEEFRLRREFVKQFSSTKGLKILDELCQKYEKNYLGGTIIKTNGYE